ncbi:succinate dehydrogenase assembly factor 2 [Flavimaricola marinus]|uniref:FAD assembly factor SdhE n=1 Tax=Flavimaricola marinus TaxID=1819565 RepID=A0A238LKR7_9RHOB|nr:succinate dehydrogenase assembly factor 2 [Flavimaricola marinus]SMY09460.1 Flavinator of succinate dehydrogenase [Flavimaricola marinus]
MTTPEPRDTAIKRLKMRSMRRGIKEMDLILSDFAGRALDGMEPAELLLYDQLLEENDHDIYGWVNGQFAVPEHYAEMIARIADGARGIVRPGVFGGAIE